MARFYALGVYPGLVEAAASGQRCRLGARSPPRSRRHDPHCRGVLLLGLDAPEAELMAAFAMARRHPVCKGFAVGRTIFAQAGRGLARRPDRRPAGDPGHGGRLSPPDRRAGRRRHERAAPAPPCARCGGPRPPRDARERRLEPMSASSCGGCGPARAWRRRPASARPAWSSSAARPTSRRAGNPGPASASAAARSRARARPRSTCPGTRSSR